MTTEEFLEAFNDVDLPGQVFTQLSGFFKHADMVKFARFIPAADRPAADFEFTHRMIDDVRADYEARQQIEANVKGALGDPTATPPTEEQPS
jgi:hypothetical protein